MENLKPTDLEAKLSGMAKPSPRIAKMITFLSQASHQLSMQSIPVTPDKHYFCILHIRAFEHLKNSLFLTH